MDHGEENQGSRIHTEPPTVPGVDFCPACVGRVGARRWTCAACDGTGRFTATPAHDPASCVIVFSGFDTAGRVYQDLTAGRCAGLGICKAPKDLATCTLYTDLGR